MNKKPLVLQQGDTIYVESNLPKNAMEQMDFDGIVQHGEATGHAHRLHGNGFTMFQTPDKKRYLRLVEPTMLKHEEHKEIELPAKIFEVRIVREYSHFEEEARAVAD